MTIEELYEQLKTEYYDAIELHRYYAKQYEEAFLDRYAMRWDEVATQEDDEVNEYRTQMQHYHNRLNQLTTALKEIERFRAT